MDEVVGSLVVWLWSGGDERGIVEGDEGVVLSGRCDALDVGGRGRFIIES